MIGMDDDFRIRDNWMQHLQSFEVPDGSTVDAYFERVCARASASACPASGRWWRPGLRHSPTRWRRPVVCGGTQACGLPSVPRTAPRSRVPARSLDDFDHTLMRRDEARSRQL
jgi:hypothetical protein